MLCRLALSADTTPTKSAGMLCTCRPKKSFTCDTMISTAMPLVKPITTATGIKRIKVPKRSRPMASSMRPDMAVATIKLAKP